MAWARLWLPEGEGPRGPGQRAGGTQAACLPPCLRYGPRWAGKQVEHLGARQGRVGAADRDARPAGSGHRAIKLGALTSWHAAGARPSPAGGRPSSLEASSAASSALQLPSCSSVQRAAGCSADSVTVSICQPAASRAEKSTADCCRSSVRDICEGEAAGRGSRRGIEFALCGETGAGAPLGAAPP